MLYSSLPPDSRLLSSTTKSAAPADTKKRTLAAAGPSHSQPTTSATVATSAANRVADEPQRKKAKRVVAADVDAASTSPPMQSCRPSESVAATAAARVSAAGNSDDDATMNEVPTSPSVAASAIRPPFGTAVHSFFGRAHPSAEMPPPADAGHRTSISLPHITPFDATGLTGVDNPRRFAAQLKARNRSLPPRRRKRSSWQPKRRIIPSPVELRSVVVPTGPLEGQTLHSGDFVMCETTTEGWQSTRTQTVRTIAQIHRIKRSAKSRLEFYVSWYYSRDNLAFEFEQATGWIRDCGFTSTDFAEYRSWTGWLLPPDAFVELVAPLAPARFRLNELGWDRKKFFLSSTGHATNRV